LKTFYVGAGGWSERQLPDGTLPLTAPTGHVYTTTPGGALFFPQLATPTGALSIPEPTEPPSPHRGTMMPRRTRTRAADRAYRIALERQHTPPASPANNCCSPNASPETTTHRRPSEPSTNRVERPPHSRRPTSETRSPSTPSSSMRPILRFTGRRLSKAATWPLHPTSDHARRLVYEVPKSWASSYP
jgi:hypothetical protein